MNLSPWFSLAPPLVAVIIAIATKQIIPALLLGLLAGGTLLSPGPISAFNKTVGYFSSTLSDIGNLQVVLFLYLFSGLVGLLAVSGGVEGFSRRVQKLVNSRRETLLTAWLLLPVTFIDCGFRVVTAGTISRPLLEKEAAAPERLAYMLNNSASPIISLIPVATTFLPYMLGVISSGLKAAGIEASPFAVFLRSIPFNFFSFTAIAVAVASIFWAPAAMRTGQRRSRRLAHAMEAAQELGWSEDQKSAHDQIGVAIAAAKDPLLKPNLWNMVGPILLLIALNFFLMWWGGRGEGRGIFEAMINASPSRMMLLALFVTIIITVIAYRAQGLHLQEMTERFFQGENKMIPVIAILALALPLAATSRDLGKIGLTDIFILRGTIAPFAVPMLMFILSGALAFFIGSSWGVWAIIMPLALPLAVASGISLPLTVGAVFSGGIFGDVTSPLSGMVALSGAAAGAEQAEYFRYQLPFNLIAAAIALILFLIAGWTVL